MLQIQTTGLEQYLPGGEACLQFMVIGGPGAGKTRFSSYFPRPIYADCEGGLSSVADRSVPFVSINSSDDMLDYLKFLKNECRKPREQRRFRTAIIDTLDAYQRKVKNEWLERNNAAVFTGFDAWGYLDTKMQLLMTRLLNLDMNVIVLVHYKDKTTTEGKGENRTETHELMLQLQGDIKDSAFNDFDLVGWMGTYWEAGENGREQKRGLTFHPTPDKPFLKDRLYITPRMLEVSFSERDYTQLFDRLTSRLDEFGESEVIGEITGHEDAPSSEGVVAPMRGGPVAPQARRQMPLDELTVRELTQMARANPMIRDEVKSSMKKADLVALIETTRGQPEPEPEKEPEKDGEKMEQAMHHADESKEEKSQAPEEQTPVEAEEAPDGPVITDDQGRSVDTETGEILTPEQVAEQLDAQVVSDDGEAEQTQEATAAAPQPPAQQPKPERVCAECGKNLSGENQDYVKLSYIKFRKLLCNEDYLAAKQAS